NMQPSKILFNDFPFGEHWAWQPIQHLLPVFGSEKHDRKVVNLARLDQRECFEQFVERAETTGEDDEGVAIYDEHHLAHKKVFELQRQRQVLIRFLLVRQFDVG